MMQVKYLLIYIFVFLLAGHLCSQNTGEYELKTNDEIYSRLINDNIEKLENQIVILGKDKIFCLVINGKEEFRDYLYSKIKQRLYNYKIISDKDSAAADYLILFKNIDFKTNYVKIFGSVIKSRKVEREIGISFVYNLKQKSSEDVLFNEKVTGKNTDDFLLDNLEQVERGEYTFLKTKLPERSFFEKTFIPGVVIIASAVTIVLFFIIRSK